MVNLVTTEEVHSVTQEHEKSVFSGKLRSVTREEVKSVTPEEVKSVIPEAVTPGIPEEIKSVTPEVVKSVVPAEAYRLVVRKATHESDCYDNEVVGVWNDFESSKSLTWREAEAVKRAVVSSVDQLRGKRVKVFSDNKNVQSVLEAGSSKEDLQEIASEVNDFCECHQISFSVGWIPISLNEKADHLSRCTDCDDWEIANWVFDKLERKWGIHTVDRFASS